MLLKIAFNIKTKIYIETNLKSNNCNIYIYYIDYENQTKLVI